MASDPCVCIVDAYSSGSCYPAELKKRGFQSVHVQSIAYPDVVAASFRPGDHLGNIVFDGNVESCVRQLREYCPVAVIAATEASVVLADRLSEALGLATNGSALSSARRNKFDMQTRIAEMGVRSIPSYLGSDWPSVKAWIEKLGRFPVVLKPPASASTDRVSFCKDLDEAKVAFDAIRAATLLLGDNDRVVVQPFVTGEEWCVQTVSCAGTHGLTDIWREDKIRRGASIIYDRTVLLPSTGEKQTEVLAYVRSVLDALGIRHGAAHTEVLVTADGPTLIEVGARLCGAYQHRMAEEVLGIDQLTLSVDAYLEPRRFFERIATPYELTRHATQVLLVSPKEGVLAALPRLDDVKRLRSYFKADIHCSPGKRIVQTVDLVSTPGIIHLVHPDPDVVEQDYRQIRQWEAENFYELAS
jgi:biotin carboxylase